MRVTAFCLCSLYNRLTFLSREKVVDVKNAWTQGQYLERDLLVVRPFHVGKLKDLPNVGRSSSSERAFSTMATVTGAGLCACTPAVASAASISAITFEKPDKYFPVPCFRE